VLELHDPRNAFASLETYLRAHGFFEADGNDSLEADLYLGYGLSANLWRATRQGPEEPCPLPLLACSVRSRAEASQSESSFGIGSWTTSWQSDDYINAIQGAKTAIAAGDVYQVNLVQHLSAPFEGDPRSFATSLAGMNHAQSKSARTLIGNDWAIISASPELFLARRGNQVWTMPIKGTRSLDSSHRLDGSAKERAEHMMIVDLERNDLARVCEAGSVRWPELMVERPMAGVSHLVSRVEGVLRPGVGFAELLEATFPGGSVTGAPKISAIDHIAALEPVGRGASMGALGTVKQNGDFDLSLTIRTFAVAEGLAHLWVGGGIVADSEPSAEVEESWIKARPLLAAIDASRARLGRVAA
jgi:para-aminobenzoate synthetase component 1